MNILFIGTQGVYHPLIAAQWYLHSIIPSQIKDIPFLGSLSIEEHGQPLLVGIDEWGNKVYILGVGYDVTMAEKSIQQLAEIFHPADEYLAVQTIRTRGEYWLFLLHRLARIPFLLEFCQRLAVALLQLNFDFICGQVQRFKNNF
ncbi:MAG TPA: DUF3189 family protein [Syntrophomonadaceae bacterium]|nr:DUF3189 family protein [Syntrophomonadaceae bacterium]